MTLGDWWRPHGVAIPRAGLNLPLESTPHGGGSFPVMSCRGPLSCSLLKSLSALLCGVPIVVPYPLAKIVPLLPRPDKCAKSAQASVSNRQTGWQRGNMGLSAEDFPEVRVQGIE